MICFKWQAEAQMVYHLPPSEEIASLALEFGRLLMQAGASASRVDAIARRVAIGLGAAHADMRAGYASLTISIGVGNDWVTRMCKVGPLGVNQRLDDALHDLAQRVGSREFGVTEIRAELADAVRGNQPRPDWLVALAVGVACAAFGRLLGVDWQGVGPIFASAALSQLARGRLGKT